MAMTFEEAMALDTTVKPEESPSAMSFEDAMKLDTSVPAEPKPMTFEEAMALPTNDTNAPSSMAQAFDQRYPKTDLTQTPAGPLAQPPAASPASVPAAEPAISMVPGLNEGGGPIAGTEPPVPSSALQTFGQEVAMSALPSSGGVAGGVVGGRALGAITGVKLAPKSPVAMIAGGLIGAIAGSYGINKAQDYVISKTIGTDAFNALQKQRETDRAANPIAATAGELLPQALTFRPSKELLVNTAKLLKQASIVGLTKAAASNPQGFEALINSAFGAGTTAATEAFNAWKAGDLSVGRMAATVALAALAQKPTALGKALGAHVPQEAKINLDVARKLYRFTDPELNKLMEASSTPPPLPKAAPQEASWRTDVVPTDEQLKVQQPSEANDMAGAEAELMAPERGEVVPSKLAAGQAAKESTPQGVKDALIESGSTEHVQQKMADVTALAETIVAQDPAHARERVFSNEGTAEQVALGDILIREARKTADSKTENDIIQHFSDLALTNGRFINMLKIFNQSISGDGLIQDIRRVAEKSGIDITSREADLENIRTMKKVINDMPEGVDKEIARDDLMNAIVDVVPPTTWDKVTAFRYSNMLSNPRATLRNLWGNAFNTFVEPIAKISQLKDAPTVYKAIFGNMKAAMQEFQDAFKTMNDVRWTEQQSIGSPEIAQARQAKIAQSLRVIPQWMNAQDKFFSKLISAGETARLVKNGVKPDVAIARAEKLAENYLYRRNIKIGWDKTAPYIANIVENAGGLMSAATKAPGIGKAASLFTPFIRTPTNVAKRLIENSPLGYFGPRVKTVAEGYAKKIAAVEGQIANSKGAKAESLNSKLEFLKSQRDDVVYMMEDQKARALTGSMITAFGALAASQGLTAWTPPEDATARAAWYASGRKNYSVRIGNKWVPMWYLGPYALALAIPAAWQAKKEENPNQNVKNVSDSAQALARFIASQTSMTGAANFWSAMSGENDITNPTASAFTAEQFVPASGLVRFVNTIADPTLRKAKTWQEQLQKDLNIDVVDMKDFAGASQKLEPYLNPDTKDPVTGYKIKGTEVKRGPSDWFTPYTLGTQDNEMEKVLQDRMDILSGKGESNVVMKEFLKDKPDVDTLKTKIFAMSNDRTERKRLWSYAKRQSPDLYKGVLTPPRSRR